MRVAKEVVSVKCVDGGFVRVEVEGQRLGHRIVATGLGVKQVRSLGAVVVLLAVAAEVNLVVRLDFTRTPVVIHKVVAAVVVNAREEDQHEDGVSLRSSMLPRSRLPHLRK